MSKFVIFRNIFYNNYAIIFIYDSLVFKISIISHNNIILGGILYMNNANLSKKCKKTLSEELQKIFYDFFSDFTKLLTTPLDLESSCIPNQHIQAAIIEIIAKKLLPNYSIQLKKNGVHIKEENHSVLFNSLLSLEPEINSILRKKNFYKMLSNINWSTEIKEIYLSKLLSGHSIKSILTADFYICLLPIIEKKINNIVCDMNIDSRNRKKYLYKKDFYGMSLQLLQNHMDNSKAWYNSKNSLLTQLSNLRLTRKQGASEQYKCKFTILNKSILDKAFVNLMHYKYINHQVKAPKFESAPELFPVSNTQVLTSTPRFLLKSLNTKLSKEKIEAVTNIIMSEIQYYNILISKELLPSKNEAENILEENIDKISSFYKTIPDIYLSNFYALGCALKNNVIFSSLFWYKCFSTLSCFKNEFSYSRTYEYKINPNLLFFYYLMNLPKNLDYQDIEKLTVFMEKYNTLLFNYTTKIEEYYSATDLKTLSKDLYYVQQEINQNKLIELFNICVRTNTLSEQIDFTIKFLPVLEKIKNNGFNDVSSSEIMQLISYFPSDPIDDLL